MKTTLIPDLQKIRSSALEHQMMALRWQAKVLTALAAEHNGGFNLRGAIQFEHLLSDTESHVERALKFSQSTMGKDADQLHDELVVLHDTKDEIVKESDRVLAFCEVRAEDRINEELDGVELIEEGIVPESAAELSVKAQTTCLRAEKEQLATFTYQVKAACDLALELAYVAASDAMKR